MSKLTPLLSFLIFFTFQIFAGNNPPMLIGRTALNQTSIAFTDTANLIGATEPQICLC